MALTFEELAKSCVGTDVTVPVLGGGRRRYVNLDNAATTPALRQVKEAVEAFLPSYSSVHRGAGYKSLVSTEVFDRCRRKVAEFVGADPRHATVIFGKNTTEMVNKLARRLPVGAGDLVVISDVEHHSNDLPWRKAGQVLRLPVDHRGAMDLNQLEDALRTNAGHVKLVAVSGASNVTGYQAPLDDIAVLAHRYGARIMADCAQLAPHRRIDVHPPGDPRHLDFVVFSAHKMYAPFGVGVLVGPKAFFDSSEPDHVGGGTVELVTPQQAFWAPSPDRDEPGTPNLLGIIALGRAIGCLMEVGFEAIAAHERELTAFALSRLRALPGVTLYGDAEPVAGEDRIGVIPFNLAGLQHARLASALSWEGAVGVRSGCFCAHPFIQKLMGLTPGDTPRLLSAMRGEGRSEVPGLVRMSFGLFNTHEDVERAVDTLGELARHGVHGEYRFDARFEEFVPVGCELEIDPRLGI